MERNVDPRHRRLTTWEANGRGRLEDSGEVPIGELFKRLSDDAGRLVRDELDLAKAELRESMTRMSQAASRLAIAFGLAISGMLALAAFLVIVIGNALNNYWLSALLVGGAFLVVAAILARRAMALVGKGKDAVREAAGSLREDAEWAKDEARAFKRELTA